MSAGGPHGASPKPGSAGAQAEAVCPFCRGDIKADLLLYGGHCPHCLIEIPGEEAPTNPNAEKVEEEQQAKVEQQVRQEKKSRLALYAFAAAAVGVLAVVMWPKPSASDFSLEDDWVIVPVSKHRDKSDPAAVAAEEAAANATNAGKGNPRKTNGTRHSDGGGGGSTHSGGAVANAAEAPPEDAPGSARVSAPTTEDPFAALSTGPGSAKEVEGKCVSREEEIEAMIRSRVKASGAQVQACYEQALKQNDDLRGRWKVNFTLGQDGHASRVQVVAQNQKDAGFESCLGKVVGGWAFQAACEPMALAVPFKFGAVDG